MICCQLDEPCGFSGDHWQMQQCLNVLTDIYQVYFPGIVPLLYSVGNKTYNYMFYYLDRTWYILGQTGSNNSIDVPAQLLCQINNMHNVDHVILGAVIFLAGVNASKIFTCLTSKILLLEMQHIYEMEENFAKIYMSHRQSYLPGAMESSPAFGFELLCFFSISMSGNYNESRLLYHYEIQCWHVITGVLRHSPDSSFTSWWVGAGKT